jgi:hypothetical protein
MSTNYEIKNNWWKVLVVAFITSLFNAIIHGMLPSGSSTLPPSILVVTGLLPIAFIIYGFVYYALLGYIFVNIQNRLHGNKLIKGLKYGLFFCILTFIIYFEPLPTTITLSITNMTWMIADGLPYIVLGALLGLFLVNDVKNELNTLKLPSKIFLLVIPLIFCIGRLISYNFFQIHSNYTNLPVITIIWVLVLGLAIGILYYYLLRPGIVSNPHITAIYFSVIFGIYIFMFNFAYALIVNLTLKGYADFFIRTFVDVIFATMGIFVYEYLVQKRNVRS